MALAARSQSFSHIHIGLLQEGEAGDETVISHQSPHSARVFEEFDLAVIFQGSWCRDLAQNSVIQVGEESFCSKDGETIQPGGDDINDSSTESGPVSGVNATQPEESTGAGQVTVTQRGDDDECSINARQMEDTERIRIDTNIKDEESSHSVAVEVLERVPVTVEEIHNASVTEKFEMKEGIEAQFQIYHDSLDTYCYGKGKQNVRNRERRDREDRKKNVQRFIDPSEIGFQFVCSRRLILECVERRENDGSDPASDHDTSPSGHGSDQADQTVSGRVDVSEGGHVDVSEGGRVDVSEGGRVDVSEGGRVDASEGGIPQMDIKPDGSISNVESQGDCVCESDLNISENEQSVQMDDESFFADLGIDIYDGGSFEWDDCLDWDGVTFSPPRPKSKSLPASNFDRKTKKNDVTSHVPIAPVAVSVPNYRLPISLQLRLFNLECQPSSVTFVRKDKHRKRQKLHKAIKTHHCRIINNLSGKTFHMHHRVLKKANLDIDFRLYGRVQLSPMPKTGVDLNVARRIRIKATPTQSHPRPKAPAQNLHHVLHETNVPSVIQHDLVSFLLSIQNRDLTPEDYEMLLRLDDTVQAKTVSNNVLTGLRTESVGEDIVHSLDCVICMEPYVMGQTRKFLPCGHHFHSDCIDSWLANNSQNCPLDGLPVADS